MRDGVGERNRYRPAALLVHASQLQPQLAGRRADGKSRFGLHLLDLCHAISRAISHAIRSLKFFPPNPLKGHHAHVSH